MRGARCAPSWRCRERPRGAAAAVGVAAACRRGTGACRAGPTRWSQVAAAGGCGGSCARGGWFRGRGQLGHPHPRRPSRGNARTGSHADPCCHERRGRHPLGGPAGGRHDPLAAATYGSGGDGPDLPALRPRRHSRAGGTWWRQNLPGAEAAQPLDDCLSARWAHLWVHRLLGWLPPGDRSPAVLDRLFRRPAGRPGTWELRGDRPRLVRAVRRAWTAHHRHVPERACAGDRRGAYRPGLDPRPWLRPGEGRGCCHPAGGSAPRAGHRPHLAADSVAARAVVRRSRNAASVHRQPGPPGDGGRRSPALPDLPPGPGHGAQGPAQAQLRGSAPHDSSRRGHLRDAAHGSRHDSIGPDDLDLVSRPARRCVGCGPAVRDGGGSRSLRWTWVMHRLNRPSLTLTGGCSVGK